MKKIIRKTCTVDRTSIDGFISGGDFDEWKPPSEAEMKVINARRERQEKISKLMGQYLLKGYKMLGSLCDLCGTILLRDKQGVDYCVACKELNSDTDKDNPVLSDEAAASQVRECSTSSTATEHSADSDLGLHYIDAAPHVVQSSSSQQQLLPNISSAASSLLARLQQGGGGGDDVEIGTASNIRRSAVNTSGSTSNLVADTRAALESRIQWANSQLSRTTQTDQIISLCDVIQKCVETIRADMSQESRWNAREEINAKNRKRYKTQKEKIAELTQLLENSKKENRKLERENADLRQIFNETLIPQNQALPLPRYHNGVDKGLKDGDVHIVPRYGANTFSVSSPATMHSIPSSPLAMNKIRNVTNYGSQPGSQPQPGSPHVTEALSVNTAETECDNHMHSLSEMERNNWMSEPSALGRCLNELPLCEKEACRQTRLELAKLDGLRVRSIDETLADLKDIDPTNFL